MITGIGIVSIKCMDWENLVAFYRDTLGIPVRLVDETHKYAMFFNGDVRLAIEDIGVAPSNPPEPDRSVVSINFRVEELEATVQEFSGKGVPFSSPILPGPGYRYAKFVDPEGNQHILFEREPS